MEEFAAMWSLYCADSFLKNKTIPHEINNVSAIMYIFVNYDD